MKADAPDVAVVGAGLVGSLWAIFLARKGYSVTVYERRADMRKQLMSAGRSINLAISERGLHALRCVGLEEEALKHATPMRGRMMHSLGGELTLQSYGKDDKQCINSISRAWLNRMLMTRAEETGRVSIQFQQKLAGFDPLRGALLLEDERTGERGEARAGVVFGADGSSSALRAELEKLSAARVSQQSLAHGYKELTISASRAQATKMDRGALHIWPRGTYMLIALPNEDGSFTCTLFLPFEGAKSFASLSSPEEVRRFFSTEFPDSLALLQDLESEFFGNPTGHMVTVKVQGWSHLGKVLLMGDAAHAIVPFYGQGMNCGFEDCVVLDALLEGQGNWPSVFSQFVERRKTHTDAIADMAVENFIEMRDLVADPQFLLEKQIEKRLLNAFPGRFLSKYSLVSFSRTHYRFAYQVGEIASAIVKELAAGISSADDVDLVKAEHLIEKRLAPLLQEHAHGLEA